MGSARVLSAYWICDMDARYHVGISVSGTTETYTRGWKDASSMSGSALGVKDSFAVAPHLPIFAVESDTLVIPAILTE
ncbi:hypothetical protein KCU92_g2588, partial [Aureobasidium melanogenum]